jgi:CubicO group peptidase (beta-lactamase class C family)
MKLFWALAIASALAAPDPARADATQWTRESQVDALFSSWTSSTPGCAVGVAENGGIVLEKAYGMADLEHDVPNTPDTIFEAGSVSKQFTAAAIFLLARDGKLSLDDSARKYVPELPDYTEPITIRQMLQHTSGLRDWGSVEGIAGWPRGTRVYTHAHVLDILSRQRALNFLPGTRWSYSNSGYNLAAIIVSRVTGESFAEFTRKRLFDPLGMTHTSWRDDYSRIVKGRAVAYAEADGRYRAEMPFENVYGNGGLLTTVGDLLRWNENFVEPTVGDSRLVQELQAPGRVSGGQEFDYAYGLGIGEYKGLREVRHSGTTGSYRAYLARYPDPQLSVALLCNAGNSTPRETLHAVADIYLREVLKPLPVPKSVSLAAAELDLLAGMYKNIERGDVVNLETDGEALRLEGERPLVALTPRRFTDGEGTVIEFDGGGGVTINDGSGAPIRLERAPLAHPADGALAQLAASYTSDEAETTLEVQLREGALVITQRPDSVYPLTPLYADAFDSEIGTIIFRRDETGQPVALSVVEDRVWDLRFRRASEVRHEPGGR